MTSAANSAFEATLRSVMELLHAHPEWVELFYEQSSAARWNIPCDEFKAVLARSAASRFQPGIPSDGDLESYLGLLHLEDLALATACVQGKEEAWDYFYRKFRTYMRAAAAAILKRNAESAEAIELGDSLMADLYGWDESKQGRGSLLRYFHGRSKLSTWLRAVLVQRQVDAIRLGRKWESIDEPEREGHAKQELPSHSGPLTTPDPDRERYLQLLSGALTKAIRSLESQDQLRLTEYYLRDQTLASIGRAMGEHEATASRKLERLRKDLRKKVEQILRTETVAANGSGVGIGLSEAQIAECFEYALEDWSFDLAKIVNSGAQTKSPAGERSSPLPEVS